MVVRMVVRIFVMRVVRTAVKMTIKRHQSIMGTTNYCM
jgi:hypothetical protein